MAFDLYNTLTINSSNDLAKYDIACWKECSLNGYYGLRLYNLVINSDKYIDIDKTHEQFYNVPHDNTELEISNINEIFLGLIGNRQIYINTDDDEVYFYGNNSNYTSTIRIPYNVNTIYFAENSFVNISSSNTNLHYIFTGSNDGNTNNNAFYLYNVSNTLNSIAIKTLNNVTTDVSMIANNSSNNANLDLHNLTIDSNCVLNISNNTHISVHG